MPIVYEYDEKTKMYEPFYYYQGKGEDPYYTAGFGQMKTKKKNIVRKDFKETPSSQTDKAIDKWKYARMNKSLLKKLQTDMLNGEYGIKKVATAMSNQKK